VAAKLRKVLNEDVDMVHGAYGEFKVLVDDRIVADGGVKAAFGVVPSDESILRAVRAALAPSD
jgi:hypothetical protein